MELTEWIILIIGIAEIVLRAVPNERTKGIIGYAIDALKVISDFFNRRGKDSDIMRR